jgi:hypothetical protein
VLRLSVYRKRNSFENVQLRLEGTPPLARQLLRVAPEGLGLGDITHSRLFVQYNQTVMRACADNWMETSAIALLAIQCDLSASH